MTQLELKRLLLDAGYYHSPHSNFFYKPGSYTLRHGEYERPEYYVRKVKGQDEYYILAKYFFLPSAFYTPRNGPLSQNDMQYLCKEAQLRKVGKS